MAMTYRNLYNLLRLLDEAELEQPVRVFDIDSLTELELSHLSKDYPPDSLIPNIILKANTAQERTD